MRLRVVLFLAVSVGLVVLLTGCPPVAVSGVTVMPAEATVEVGQSLGLEARVRPAKASQLVTWASDAVGIVSVNSAGVVTGNAVGTATITATSAANTSVTASAAITVTAPTDPDPDLDPDPYPDPDPDPDPSPDDGPTSGELIDEAFARGDIDEETAVVYHVFAAFGDARLPGEYRGRPSSVPALFMLDLVVQFGRYSPETQALLEPFLTPPYAEGSWLQTTDAGDGIVTQQDIRWRTLISSNDRVKVWWQERYPDDEARARMVVAEIDYNIWPKLIGLGLPEPEPDGRMDNNGGDDRLDIYLVRRPGAVLGQAVGYLRGGDPLDDIPLWEDPRCIVTPTPTFILLNTGDGPSDLALQRLLAHEFMHVLQFSHELRHHPCREYAWWMEASATWAMDYVYPHYHGLHDAFQDRPHRPLNWVDWREGLPSDWFATLGSYHYGAAMWPFFLGKEYQHPEIVAEIWKNCEEHNSLEATERALKNLPNIDSDKGGFEQVWPQFVLHNWNQEPVTDYQVWSNRTLVRPPLTHPYRPQLDGGSDQILEMMTGIDDLDPASLEPLSALYYHFTFTDDDVRWVEFLNGFSLEIGSATIPEAVDRFFGSLPIPLPVDLEFTPDAASSTVHTSKELEEESLRGRHVWLIPMIDGEWQEPQDATAGLAARMWCRDTPDERLDELVVIFSNSNHDGTELAPMGHKPALRYSNMGCHEWTGSVEVVINATTSWETDKEVYREATEHSLRVEGFVLQRWVDDTRPPDTGVDPPVVVADLPELPDSPTEMFYLGILHYSYLDGQATVTETYTGESRNEYWTGSRWRTCECRYNGKEVVSQTEANFIVNQSTWLAVLDGPMYRTVNLGTGSLAPYIPPPYGQFQCWCDDGAAWGGDLGDRIGFVGVGGQLFVDPSTGEVVPLQSQVPAWCDEGAPYSVGPPHPRVERDGAHVRFTRSVGCASSEHTDLQITFTLELQSTHEE